MRTASELVERLGKERELRRTAVAKLRANYRGGAADAQVIATFEDGWLLDDAEWARCAGDATRLATRVKADEEGRIVGVGLSDCRDMKELPASVGKLQALTKLSLSYCEGLTSLPAELGQLQALTELNQSYSSGLTSQPAELRQQQALTARPVRLQGLTSLPAGSASCRR